MIHLVDVVRHHIKHDRLISLRYLFLFNLLNLSTTVSDPTFLKARFIFTVKFTFDLAFSQFCFLITRERNSAAARLMASSQYFSLYSIWRFQVCFLPFPNSNFRYLYRKYKIISHPFLNSLHLDIYVNKLST